MSLKEFLKDKRPSLSDSSINTYASLIRSLYRKIWEGEVDTDNLKKTGKVLEALKDVPPNKRKTTLSALVIATGEEKYRDLMMKDIKTYREEINKQEKTESQEENWVTQDEVKAKYIELQKRAAKLYKKHELTSADLQHIQDYIILALLSGVNIPVRRSKDFTDFKIRDINKEKDNYIDGKELVFNSYKTAKHYGEQRIKMNTKLKNILSKWISVNPSDYLLIDSRNQPLVGPNASSTNGAVKLNQRLQKIFGKKAGVNMLRHSILTDKFGGEDDAEKVMKDMGSSTQNLKTYVKKD